MEKYIIEEGTKNYKGPKVPNIKDYYDVNESAEDRAERLFLYSEVREIE